MQELQLISIGMLLQGGTTKPFNVVALDADGLIGKYIVKAFTKNQISQNASVAKEIIVSELAKMFDINAPDYGVINFKHVELQGVYDSERLVTLDEGSKYCSKFAEQFAIFTPTTSKAYLKDYEISNIFAFDVLIHNADRGGARNKPNLMINDNELLIIDHELTLPWGNTSLVDNYEKYLSFYQFQNHILIKYLKSLKMKKNIFDEFLINLNNLNLNNLNNVFDEMDKYKIQYFDRENFMNYFRWAKNNVSIFERYLNGMIK